MTQVSSHVELLAQVSFEFGQCKAEASLTITNHVVENAYFATMKEEIEYDEDKKEKGKNITFIPLTKASVGDDIYIVVETKSLQGKTIKINVRQGKQNIIGEIDKALTITQNGQSIMKIKACVGELADYDKHLNKDYLKNLAVAQVTLAPKEEKNIEDWVKKIKATPDKKTYLYLLIEADVTEEVKYYGKNADGSDDYERRFSNADGEWLELNENAIKNGHYYNEDGTFEGKVDEEAREGSVKDVYTCKGKETIKNGEVEEVIEYKDAKLLKEGENNITHYDFCYIAYIVRHEAGGSVLKELKCIAFTSYNRAKSKKETWKKLLSTGYSSVPNKKPLSETKKSTKDKLTRKALFSVLKGEDDISKGAEYWDGTDFLAWGNSETNPWNKLGQNKFDEYKFIEIPKDVYDDYLAANGSSVMYGDKGNHPETGDKGTHIHVKKKVKEKVIGEDGKPVLDEKGKPTYKEVEKPHRIKYSIPADEFTNDDYWKTGSFYYDTGVKTTYGISATISAGKSIFWKRTTKRLTSDKVIKKDETKKD